jgi:hypothetical protein
MTLAQWNEKMAKLLELRPTLTPHQYKQRLEALYDELRVPPQQGLAAGFGPGIPVKITPWPY